MKIILRVQEVKKLTGYPSNTSIYGSMKAGLFPKQVKIGVRSVGWPKYEVEVIVAARIAGWNDDQIRRLVNRLHEQRVQLLDPTDAQAFGCEVSHG